MDGFWIGIVGNLLASFIFEILRPHLPLLHGQITQGSSSQLGRNDPESFSYPTTDDIELDIFSRRRRTVQGFIRGVFFYFIHLYLLSFAISLPISVYLQLNQHGISLSNARFIGHLLPAIRFETFPFDINFLKITLTLVFPLFLVARFISLPFWKLGAYFGYRDLFFQRKVQFSVYLILCIVIAAHTVYLFFPVPYETAWGSVLIAVLFGFLYSSSSSSNRS
jgi:hypothetical protein